MISGALSWLWPVIRPSGYHCLSISEAVDKFVPVLLVRCFPNPALERAVVVDSDFWYIGKEETQVSHNEVFVVEERMSYSSSVVAVCSQHLLCWPVKWTTYCLPDKVELMGGDHIGHKMYVVKHSPDMFVLNAILTHFCHPHSKNSLNVMMQEDFKLVREGFLHRPCLASQQKQVHQNCSK